MSAAEACENQPQCGVPNASGTATSQASHRPPALTFVSLPSLPTHHPPVARSARRKGTQRAPFTISSNKKTSLTGYIPDILMAAAAVRTLALCTALSPHTHAATPR
jgi:hypothetical protein